MKTVSNYRVKVLDVNASLKKESKTLGGAIKLLKALTEDETTLNAINSVDFKKLKKVCRKSKKGNYSPFFILQALYKIGLTNPDNEAFIG